MNQRNSNLRTQLSRCTHSGALACVAIFGLTWLVSCGAPIQSPAEVASQFSNRDQHSLDLKITSLCEELSIRTVSPTLRDLPFQASDCSGAGKHAADIKKVDQVPFIGLLEDGKTTKMTDKSAIVKTRGQFYLNEKLLNVAAKLAGKLGGFADGGKSPFDSATKGQGGLSDILNLEPIDIEKPKKRDDEISFELPLRIKADGLIRLDLNLEIGILVGKSGVAISIRSPEEVDLKKGLIRRIDALMLIVPHADDVYIDMLSDMRLNKLGTIDSLITGLITKFLPALPKLFIDVVEKGGDT